MSEMSERDEVAHQMTVDRLFKIRQLLIELYTEAAMLERDGTNTMAILFGRSMAEGSIGRHRELLDMLKAMGWPKPSNRALEWPREAGGDE